MPKLCRPALTRAVLALAAFASALFVGWGFTVDDALISTRFAQHLRAGVGYRFNPDGDVVDGVTPLGWAPLLAPVSPDPLTGLQAARLLGVAATLLVALFIASRAKGVPVLRFVVCLLPIAVCLPLGAWASSGMETPLVMLLISAMLLRTRARFWFGSLAAALRPELVPFVLVSALSWPANSRRQRALHVAVALALPLVVVAVRLVVFGHPAPLSVLAKPSDFASGLRYALGGVVLLGLPVMLFTLRPYASLSRAARAFALASVAHVGALVVAGGDWMALFRLFVPILPVWLHVSLELARTGSLRALVARSLVASALGLALLLVKGPAARGVFAHRLALIHEARPLLAGSFRVATLDVGWVGAATSSPLVDLAGVTDPEVAALPGGHTSKRLPPDFLERRAPDTLVLLLADDADVAEDHSWTELSFARAVEARVARLDAAREFVAIGKLKLGGTQQSYLVLRRISDRLASGRRGGIPGARARPLP